MDAGLLRNDFPPQVASALHMIRKAEVAKQQLELQAEQNEKKIKAGLAALTAKLNSNKRKKKPAKKPDDHILDQRPPLKFKNMPELKRRAQLFYAFANSQRLLRERSAVKSGLPRVIFPDLLAEIKQMTLDSLDAPILDPFATLLSQGQGQSQGKQLRPLTARSGVVRLRNDGDEPPQQPPAPSPLRRPKSANSALAKRDAMNLQRDNELLEKIRARDMRDQTRFSVLQRKQLQKALMVICCFARHQSVMSSKWAQLMEKRASIKRNW